MKSFIPKYFIVFPAILCWLKALGICTEGLWIRADFLYEACNHNLKPAFYPF